MIELLEKALAEVAKLPEREQEEVATWLLEELAADRRWHESFESSADLLGTMADESLAEHERHATQPLNPQAM
jgi:hypothetical protein